MSGSLNKVCIIGNICRDPETRTMPSGDMMCNLSVATNETWKDKTTGEKREKTEFHRVVIFNKHLADIAHQYLKKGSKVYLEGSLQTRSWESEGVTRYSTEVVLQRFRGELVMLGDKPTEPFPNGDPVDWSAVSAHPKPVTGSPQDPQSPPEEIPFS